MAHEVLSGTHSRLSIIRIVGDVEGADFLPQQAFEALESGKQMYFLIDTSRMNLGLPEDFLKNIHNTLLSHPNTRHTAVYVSSAWVSRLATMIAKLTRQRQKLSIHSDYNTALAHLQQLVKEAVD